MVSTVQRYCASAGTGRWPDQVERLADELCHSWRSQLLIIGKADIGMGMAADVDGLDRSRGSSSSRE